MVSLTKLLISHLVCFFAISSLVLLSQVLTLLTNLGSTLANYFIVDPKMEGYMQQMHKFEKEHGHGHEVGPITDDALLGNSQYKEIRKNFFVCHGVSTTLNLLGFVSTGVYLWFLSKKIQF